MPGQDETGPLGVEQDRLGDLVDGIAADVGFSGVVRVDLDGNVAVQRAYGLAHRGLGVPTNPDTQFGIASGSKGLTALTVMSLVERGELQLDTTARSVLGTDLALIDDRVTSYPRAIRRAARIGETPRTRASEAAPSASCSRTIQRLAFI